MTLIESDNSLEQAILSKNIRAYNNSIVGESNSKPITLVIKDDSDKIIAGLSGRTSRGWLFVEVLWVEESLREKDLGTELLKRAEVESKNRGCDFAYVVTFSFQALGFYEKQGYKKFGELENFPKGHSRYFMMKAI